MIFSNSPYLLLAIFLITVIFQYARYKHIANKYYGVSSILIIKILIRALIVVLFMVSAKVILRVNSTNNHPQRINAVFIISTNNIQNFKLTEDDQTNIRTNLASNLFSKFEIRLYNVQDKQFYLYIPPTSENTFVHLLSVERPFKQSLFSIHTPLIPEFQQTKRIELYEIINSQWRLSGKNQDDFNIFDFLNDENTFVSPFLVHYLLILMICLLSLDIGIKYRILKI